MQKQMEILLSKRKLALLLLAAICFVALSSWFVISPSTFITSFLSDTILISIIGIIGILFAGLGTIYYTYKLFDNKPGLIINNIELIDNSSFIGCSHILWKDINSISVIEIHRQKLIMLHIRNPQDYIDNQKSVIKKKALQWNYRTYSTPIAITSNGLQTSHNELLAILVNYFDESRDNLS